MAPDTMTVEKEKNSMCKAMGALFLQHRVHCMEKEVEQKQQRCPVRRRMGGGGGAGGAGSSNASISTTASSKKSGASSDVRPSTSPPSPITAACKVIVVDASVLIYSLRSVHQWLKSGDVRVVVPSEAMRTLDLLKCGDDAINVAARKAARFLEDNFSQQQAVGAKTVLPAGLWPQCDSQRRDIEQARLIAGGRTRSDAKGSDDEGDDISHAPIWVREPLLCALWQQQTVAASSTSSQQPSFALALALPPTDSRDEAATPRYSERADGSNVLSWAQLCGLHQDGDSASILITPTSTSWLDLAKRGPSCRQRCQQRRQERQDQGPKPITVLPSPKQQQQQQQPRAILQRGA